MIKIKLLQDLPTLPQITKSGTIKTENEWVKVIGREGGITWKGEVIGSDKKWFEIVKD